MRDEEPVNIYKTHFVNMMPQRGFLTSVQPLISIIDVDLSDEKVFEIVSFKDGDIPFIFVKNGPFRINPYQEYFSVESNNVQDLEVFDSYKFYFIKNKEIIKQPGLSTFIDTSFEFEKIIFKKEKKDNQICYRINPKDIKILNNLDYKFVICSSSKKEDIDPLYSLKILINNNTSVTKFYKEGYNSVISFIDEKFKELKLSGNLYRTKNGLRVILNDKFRNISDLNKKDDIIKLFEEFGLDDGLLTAYKREEDSRLKNYLTRLTPKLKNYKIFDNSYKTILDHLEVINLSSLNTEKNTVPIKYDFNQVHYINENKNEFIDNSFDILKELIFKYLKNDKYAVCSLIKTYNYTKQNKTINKFIEYHDKWTKAHLKDTILI